MYPGGRADLSVVNEVNSTGSILDVSDLRQSSQSQIVRVIDSNNIQLKNMMRIIPYQCLMPVDADTAVFSNPVPKEWVESF